MQLATLYTLGSFSVHHSNISVNSTSVFCMRALKQRDPRFTKNSSLGLRWNQLLQDYRPTFPQQRMRNRSQIHSEEWNNKRAKPQPGLQGNLLADDSIDISIVQTKSNVIHGSNNPTGSPVVSTPHMSNKLRCPEATSFLPGVYSLPA